MFGNGARSVVRAFASVAAVAGALVWCRGDARGGAAREPAAGAIARIGTDALATGVAPGLSIAVVHRGHIVAEQGFGVAETATNTPVTPATRFAIGSLSKQFTAAAVLVLAHAGKLSLDDTLHAYEPSLPNAREITLRMLLVQTSGLHGYPRMSEHPWPTSGTIATSQIIAMLARDRPDFAPGSQWEYSNANYAALTAIVERASGSSYAEYLRQTIFEPLQPHRRSMQRHVASGTDWRPAPSIARGSPTSSPRHSHPRSWRRSRNRSRRSVRSAPLP